MSGDIFNSLGVVRRLLSRMKYDVFIDLNKLLNGEPESFLPIIHFALLNYSTHVAKYIVDQGFELFSKNDLRFTETLFRLVRVLFDYNPKLSVHQFLQAGYGLPKLTLLADLLQKVIKKDEEFNPSSRGRSKSRASRDPMARAHSPSQLKAAIRSSSRANLSTSKGPNNRTQSQPRGRAQATTRPPFRPSSKAPPVPAPRPISRASSRPATSRYSIANMASQRATTTASPPQSSQASFLPATADTTHASAFPNMPTVLPMTYYPHAPHACACTGMQQQQQCCHTCVHHPTPSQTRTQSVPACPHTQYPPSHAHAHGVADMQGQGQGHMLPHHPQMQQSLPAHVVPAPNCPSTSIPTSISTSTPHNTTAHSPAAIKPCSTAFNTKSGANGASRVGVTDVTAHSNNNVAYPWNHPSTPTYGTHLPATVHPSTQIIGDMPKTTFNMSSDAVMSSLPSPATHPLAAPSHPSSAGISDSGKKTLNGKSEQALSSLVTAVTTLVQTQASMKFKLDIVSDKYDDLDIRLRKLFRNLESQTERSQPSTSPPSRKKQAHFSQNIPESSRISNSENSLGLSLRAPATASSTAASAAVADAVTASARLQISSPFTVTTPSMVSPTSGQSPSLPASSASAFPPIGVSLHTLNSPTRLASPTRLGQVDTSVGLDANSTRHNTPRHKRTHIGNGGNYDNYSQNNDNYRQSGTSYKDSNSNPSGKPHLSGKTYSPESHASSRSSGAIQTYLSDVEANAVLRASMRTIPRELLPLSHAAVPSSEGEMGAQDADRDTYHAQMQQRATFVARGGQFHTSSDSQGSDRGRSRVSDADASTRVEGMMIPVHIIDAGVAAVDVDSEESGLNQGQYHGTPVGPNQSTASVSTASSYTASSPYTASPHYTASQYSEVHYTMNAQHDISLPLYQTASTSTFPKDTTHSTAHSSPSTSFADDVVLSGAPRTVSPSPPAQVFASPPLHIGSSPTRPRPRAHAQPSPQATGRALPSVLTSAAGAGAISASALGYGYGQGYMYEQKEVKTPLRSPTGLHPENTPAEKQNSRIRSPPFGSGNFPRGSSPVPSPLAVASAPSPTTILTRLPSPTPSASSHASYPLSQAQSHTQSHTHAGTDSGPSTPISPSASAPAVAAATAATDAGVADASHGVRHDMERDIHGYSSPSAAAYVSSASSSPSSSSIAASASRQPQLHHLASAPPAADITLPLSRPLSTLSSPHQHHSPSPSRARAGGSGMGSTSRTHTLTSRSGVIQTMEAEYIGNTSNDGIDGVYLSMSPSDPTSASAPAASVIYPTYPSSSSLSSHSSSHAQHHAETSDRGVASPQPALSSAQLLALLTQRLDATQILLEQAQGLM